MKNSSLHRQAGLNLIEVLISALVLSVGLLGLAGLQMSSLKSAQIATARQQATVVVHELLERMRGNRQAVLNGDYSKSVTCSATPPGGCSANACTPAQLAAHDLYTVLCGNGSADRMALQLLDSTLTVTCAAGGCEQVQVSVSWTERIAERGIVAPATGTAEGGTTSGHAQELESELFSLQVNAVI